jgi:hypothetical protein
MTTTTMNGLNAGFGAASFKKPSFLDMRAALPDMPAEGTTLAHIANVATRVSLAAVPFVALGWLFIAR